MSEPARPQEQAPEPDQPSAELGPPRPPEPEDRALVEQAPHKPELKPYSQRRHRETLRGWLALALVIAYTVLTLGYVIASAVVGGASGLRDAFKDALTATLGLVGAAVGFYFSASRDDD